MGIFIMNISNEIIDEIKISDVNVYEDISNSFRSVLNINPRFEKEIQEIYIKTLENYGRTTLSAFHLKYMEMFNILAKFYQENNDELIDFADSLITIISSYFRELDLSLNIKSQSDLDELKYILQISLLLMEEVIEDKNIELAYESFFQIERRIEKHQLYKKSVHIVDDDNIQIRVSIQEKPTIYEDNNTTLKLNERSIGDSGVREYEL